MTLEEIKSLDTDMLNSHQVGSFLKIDTGRLGEYARKNMLPFPFILSGNRLKVPRISFINWAEGKPQEKEPDPILKAMEKVADELHAHTVAQTAQNAMLLALLLEIAPNIREKVDEVVKKTGGTMQ